MTGVILAAVVIVLVVSADSVRRRRRLRRALRSSAAVGATFTFTCFVDATTFLDHGAWRSRRVAWPLAVRCLVATDGELLRLFPLDHRLARPWSIDIRGMAPASRGRMCFERITTQVDPPYHPAIVLHVPSGSGARPDVVRLGRRSWDDVDFRASPIWSLVRAAV